MTTLDPTVPLGEARDPNLTFRECAAKHIELLVSEIAPSAFRMTSTNAADIVEATSKFIFDQLPTGKA